MVQPTCGARDTSTDEQQCARRCADAVVAVVVVVVSAGWRSFFGPLLGVAHRPGVGHAP